MNSSCLRDYKEYWMIFILSMIDLLVGIGTIHKLGRRIPIVYDGRHTVILCKCATVNIVYGGCMEIQAHIWILLRRFIVA